MHLPLRGAVAPLTLAGVRVTSPLLTGLLAYYKLDEVSGSRADSVGSNNLTSINATGSATGKINSAAQFVAASQTFLSGTDANLVFSGVDFSVSAWAMTEAVFSGPADGKGIASVRNGDAIGDWAISVDTTRRIHFVHWKSAGNDTTGDHITTSGQLSSDSVWYHVVCTRSAGPTYTVYVNGSSVSLNAAAATGTGWGSNDFNLGRRFQSAIYTWNGRIDELGIWNRALTSGEVASLYGSGSGLAYPFS